MEMMMDDIYQKRKQFFNDHAQQWHDKWYKDPVTGRYDKHDREFNRLFSLFTLNPGNTVLDAGCGAGILVPFILDRITSTGVLYELDFSEQMISTNRHFNARENVRFMVSDVENAPLAANTFDAVICFSCFPHFHDKKGAMRVLSEVLKPAGALVVSHFGSSEELNAHHESCDAVMHDHLPPAEDMQKLFQNAKLTIETFIDEPGFYCIVAGKG